jgi:hypothetical protein
LRDCVAEGDRIPNERFLKRVHQRFTSPPVAGLVKRKNRSMGEIDCTNDGVVSRIKRRNRCVLRRRLAG